MSTFRDLLGPLNENYPEPPIPTAPYPVFFKDLYAMSELDHFLMSYCRIIIQQQSRSWPFSLKVVQTSTNQVVINCVCSQSEFEFQVISPSLTMTYQLFFHEISCLINGRDMSFTDWVASFKEAVNINSKFFNSTEFSWFLGVDSEMNKRAASSNPSGFIEEANVILTTLSRYTHYVSLIGQCQIPNVELPIIFSQSPLYGSKTSFFVDRKDQDISDALKETVDSQNPFIYPLCIYMSWCFHQWATQLIKCVDAMDPVVFEVNLTQFIEGCVLFYQKFSGYELFLHNGLPSKYRGDFSVVSSQYNSWLISPYSHEWKGWLLHFMRWCENSNMNIDIEAILEKLSLKF